MPTTALILPPQDILRSHIYHQIVSATLTIPDEPTVSIPVGLLACQRDPLLKELKSIVVSATKFSEPPATAKKASKKGHGAAPSEDAVLLEVILHDTVLFPEGGGQPCDHGSLELFPGKTFEVIDVKRRGGHAVHFVKLSSHDDIARFKPGAEVLVALGERGLKRRRDHMSMHTGQHLLSAVLENEFALPTLSWSLTAHPTPSYVELPRLLTLTEITAIQDRVNSLGSAGQRVHVEVQELDGQRTDAAFSESGRTVGKGLPEDYTGGIHRTVVIEGIDRNPCCGTHLPTTAGLQFFLLPQTESVARGSSTTSRLLFLAGPRIVDYLSFTYLQLTRAANSLSCNAPLVPNRVEQVIADRKKATKRAEELETEVAGAIVRDVVSSIVSQNTAAPEGLAKVRRHRVEDSDNVFSFLSTISSGVFAHELTGRYLVVLSSTPTSPSSTATSTLLIFGSDDKAVLAMGSTLRSVLGAKGGGKPPRWSGKVTGVWLENREGKVIGDALAEL